MENLPQEDHKAHLDKRGCIFQVLEHFKTIDNIDFTKKKKEIKHYNIFKRFQIMKH